MRCLFVCFVAFGLLSSAPARADENDVEKMKAELKALREENEKLKEQVKELVGEFQKIGREAEKVRAEQVKLDGAWVVESATINGKLVASDKGGVVEFLGNRVTAKLPGSQSPIRKEVSLIPSAQQMNFKELGDAQWARTYTSLDHTHGSYELNGDTLRIGLNTYVLATSTSDENQVLWVLKRKK